MKLANSLLLVLTACVCLAQMYLWYGLLPDVLPAHFDATGNVDGEMNKNLFYGMFAGLHLMLLVGFPVLASLLRRMPNSVINVPNKEYWLAPERREQSLTTNAGVLIATGWMTSWLLIAIFQLSSDVATGVRNNINPEFLWIFGIYIFAIAAVIVWLFLKFRIPDSLDQPQTRIT